MTWLKLAKVGRGLTFLWRNENEGMDFAAHNATLEWYLHRRAVRCVYVHTLPLCPDAAFVS